MLRTFTFIVLLGICLISKASVLPEDQLSFHQNAMTTENMVLQSQYKDNPDNWYTMDRMDIRAEAAPRPIKLNTYPGIYAVPSKEYVDGMKTAITPRTMFSVLDREHTWRPHIGVLPNVKSRETVLALAQMANNAYSSSDHEKDWRDIDGHWNTVRQIAV